MALDANLNGQEPVPGQLKSYYTVEPLGTDTSLIRTPLYYGQFSMFRQNSHTSSFKKTSIIRTLSNKDNGH